MVPAKVQKFIKTEYSALFTRHFSGNTSEGVNSMQDFLAGLQFRMEEIARESKTFDASNCEASTLPQGLQALAALLLQKSDELQKMADLAFAATRAGGIDIQQKEAVDGSSNSSSDSS